MRDPIDGFRRGDPVMRHRGRQSSDDHIHNRVQQRRQHGQRAEIQSCQHCAKARVVDPDIEHDGARLALRQPQRLGKHIRDREIDRCQQRTTGTQSRFLWIARAAWLIASLAMTALAGHQPSESENYQSSCRPPGRISQTPRHPAGTVPMHAHNRCREMPDVYPPPRPAAPAPATPPRARAGRRCPRTLRATRQSSLRNQSGAGSPRCAARA